MSTERESDGIGELTEDLLRIAILIGNAAGSTPRPAAGQPARAGGPTVRAGARAGGAHPGARARRGAVLTVRCAVAGVVGSRRRRRHPQGVDDRARVAGTGSPRGRGGLSDGRRAAATATGWTCARPTQRPGRTAADPGADDAERRRSSSPTTSACTSSSSGSPSSARSSPATIRLSTRRRSSACQQLQEQTGELTEIRDLIAEDLADRRQQEPEARPRAGRA